MTITARQRNRGVAVFCYLWLLLFILYVPTVKAGFVADFTGWMDQLKHLSFTQYLNRYSSHITSLYQFTQLSTYVLYKLFGLNPWLWFLLHISLQALNSALLYTICKNLFDDAGIDNGSLIAAGGVLLFCICPHLSETVVWKPSFHYLQGFLFILLILRWLQLYQRQQQLKYAWGAAIIFLLSTYSLEVFYLTPWFVLSLAAYYRFILKEDKTIFRKVLLYFFLPQMLLFGVHLIVFHSVYGNWVPHIAGTMNNAYPFYLSKPLKYIFHILFMGRFFSNNVRMAFYDFTESNLGIILFYALFAAVSSWLIVSFKKMTLKAKTACLLYIWVLIVMSILIPLGFPKLLLVYGDRYTYLLDAFTYMLLGLLLSYITVKYLAIAIWLAYASINIFFTIKVNRYWKHSAYVLQRLMTTFPDAGNKTVILLDVPDNMQGIPMIHTSPDGEYKILHDLTMPIPIKNMVYDAVAFNMLTKDDGVHVTVINDSMVKVTLNQWGTWWWNNTIGAVNYENKDFKVNLTDPGHEYELSIKGPASQYLLLYQVGGVWKEVNLNRKNVKQD